MLRILIPNATAIYRGFLSFWIPSACLVSAGEVPPVRAKGKGGVTGKMQSASGYRPREPKEELQMYHQQW